MVLCNECQSSIRIPRAGEKIDGTVIYQARLIAGPGELDEPIRSLETDSRSLESNAAESNALESNAPGSNAAESPADLVSAPKRIRDREKKVSNSNGFASNQSSAGNPFDFLNKQSELDSIQVSEILPIHVDQSESSNQDAAEVIIERDSKPDYDPNRDRLWLTRFYAACLFVVGLVNIVPVIALLTAYNQYLSQSVLPRWAFVSIFLSLIFVAYAVYLVQLADWSSLLVVSVFVLLVACLYGFLAAALWLGNPTGTIAVALQIPQAYFHFGPIWGGIMFCLLALASFTFGRDAFAWQHGIAEVILHSTSR